MDYVNFLIKANKALLRKVKQLQSEMEDLKSSQGSEDAYYEKFNRVNAENLLLKDQVAKLELENYSKDRELEKRNALILDLKSAQK